ncbi:hypothetical protein [Aquisphaera insulae]|uniref:hypothetical protein n=1 Tax=Aquisphaera insulae TaxID=2712864 RepID=UPI0013EA84E2|nr:hypothetical protein [Aquisphaera insulae]
MLWFRRRTAARHRVAARPQRSPLRPGTESLEGRTLLSGASSIFGSGGGDGIQSWLFPKPPTRYPATVKVVFPGNVDGRTNALMELSKIDAPLRQQIRGSVVLKAPRFPTTYTGPMRLDLNVIGSSAFYRPEQGFFFKGRLLGPTTTSDESVYSFLVNRGGATAAGPAGGIRSIVYDAIVEVTKGAGGTTAEVDLVDAGGQVVSTTDLPPSLVRISGNSVAVTVPKDLLPATNATGVNRYSYSFQAAAPGGQASDIAGLSPEHNVTIIAGAAPKGISARA